MTIQKFIRQKLDEGFTLRRLSKVLNVSTTALSSQQNNQYKKVSLSLARSIYLKFDILLDGFHKDEIEDGDSSMVLQSFFYKMKDLEETIELLNYEIYSKDESIDTYEEEIIKLKETIELLNEDLYSKNDRIEELERYIRDTEQELQHMYKQLERSNLEIKHYETSNSN
jgi:prefoldin subunit 5